MAVATIRRTPPLSMPETTIANWDHDWYRDDLPGSALRSEVHHLFGDGAVDLVAFPVDS
jgi:hypothetical protein